MKADQLILLFVSVQLIDVMFATGSLGSELLARIVVTISIDNSWVSLFDASWSTNATAVSEVVKNLKANSDKV